MTVIVVVGIVVGIGYFIIKAYDSGPSDQDPTGYITVTQKQAMERLHKEKDSIILDVRTPKECVGDQLPKSIQIPFDDLETEAKKKLPDKGSPIFVYCDGGVRSRAGSKKLVFLGYNKVYNIVDINE